MLRPGDILSFREMCAAENKEMLQQGMTFRTEKPHSIFLMSQRRNAPYPDRLSADGFTLLYVGHHAYGSQDKERIDQPLATRRGTLTLNGKFFQAMESVRQGVRRELIRVYEKLAGGIWVFNGIFELRDARMESAPFFEDKNSRIPLGHRKVCVFELHLLEGPAQIEEEDLEVSASPGRLIPTEVKIAVFKRDKGRCTMCPSTTNLHFDHIIPWSKGGSSTNPENIQLLCQRHNLEKSAKIE
jgi:hypothetical protein